MTTNDDSNDTTTTDAESADEQNDESQPPIFTDSTGSTELEWEDDGGTEPRNHHVITTTFKVDGVGERELPEFEEVLREDDDGDDDTPAADPDLLLEAATELETLQRALLQELGDNVTPGDVRPDDNWYAGYEMARKLREAAGCTCDPGSDDACDTCGGKKGGGLA